MFSISQEIYVCHGMTSSLEGWGTETVAFENWFWISLNNKENVTNILYLMETLEHDVFGKWKWKSLTYLLKEQIFFSHSRLIIINHNLKF